VPAEFIQACKGSPFSGRPNRLSAQTADWPIIDRAIRAAVKPPGPSPAHELPALTLRYARGNPRSAADVITARRSAVAFDPGRELPRPDFCAILERTLARKGGLPFDLGLDAPQVNLVLFVHRVRGIPPGLYLLLRTPEQAGDLRARLLDDFAWQRADDHLPLWLLHGADLAHEAMGMSCHQAIAGDSAFAAAMLAPFAGPVTRHPHRYRHLHWECGMIGQVLYLEAEAASVRGTGIGCFFDDGVHELLGLEGIRYQSLYHFTVGYPIEDARLSTLPAYHHLRS
jgi:nitroreductase